MELRKSNDKSRSLYIVLLIAGIVLVAFNLRPAITSLGPLVGMIQEDVGLAHWSAGLLMSLPLLAFAIMSPVVPKLANRLTNELLLVVGLCILLIGIGIRSISMVFFLFTGTLFIGIGIAVGNVLLPAIVKDKFPKKFSLMTSVYSTSMGVVASLASGVSVPLANGLNLGWQGALLVWGVPTVMAILIWVYLLKYNQGNQTEIKKGRSGDNQIWRSPLAWQIAIFMGFQSFLFYVTIAWLPEILHDHGLSMETAGWLLSFAQIMGLPASFFIPVIAGRLRSQLWLAFGLGLCSITGYGGLLLGSSYPILITSIILIGIALGGYFPLALSYIGLRARSARQAAELSGMAQSIGYILAAVGPMFIGYLYDFAHVWTVPLMTMIIISLLVMVFGMSSGRDQYV
ncbi:CynX/NimT family MFS transporter [Metabacillus rhizolycopersici]|uniref:MFS transporter n=1 Tax=Metabacillus rhizolycopersici TaxID=2875709 RepID=A0ABS7UW75_9BACI|nr:MFS transporter [Metabacillus rhizolycopersici]MBZ5752565.1 MFS transporter [Metabacillus rhizolycopersici]